MTCQELKTKQRKEYEDFCKDAVFYAFSNEQFKEGLKKLGVTADEIYSIPGGGFVRKSHSEDMGTLINKLWEERQQALKNETILLEALSYELANHEYCITRDPSDALEALGLTAADVPEHIMDKAKRNAA